MEPVRALYDENVEQEWIRLDRPFHRAEFLGTLHLMEKYFPEKGKVADVGCGPGRYSIALLERGYEVTLVDLSGGLLKKAQQEMASRGLRPDAVHQASATDLSMLSTEGFDAVTLMGPMYHLVEREDRAQALRELRRVLRTGGIGIVAWCNVWGQMRNVLQRHPDVYGKREYLESLLFEKASAGDGGGDTPMWWRTTPPAAQAELEAAGFEVVSYAGVEGYAAGQRAWMPELAKNHPKAYEEIMAFLPQTVEHPAFRDSTEHVVFVVRKRA